MRASALLPPYWPLSGIDIVSLFGVKTCFPQFFSWYSNCRAKNGEKITVVIFLNYVFLWFRKNFHLNSSRGNLKFDANTFFLHSFFLPGFACFLSYFLVLLFPLFLKKNQVFCLEAKKHIFGINNRKPTMTGPCVPSYEEHSQYDDL